MPVRCDRLRIERRLDRRRDVAPSRAASPRAHGRGGCASARRRSARRCGGCRVPGEPRSRAAIARVDLDQRLGLAGDDHATSSSRRSEHQPVAVAQTSPALSADRAGTVGSRRIARAVTRWRDARSRSTAGVALRFHAGDRARDCTWSSIRSSAARSPQRPRHTAAASLIATHAHALACDQNRKYRCAIGSTSAGAQVSSSPSARTS